MAATARPTSWTFQCSVHPLATSGDVDAVYCGWWERSLHLLWQIIGSLTRSIHLCTDMGRSQVEPGKSSYLMWEPPIPSCSATALEQIFPRGQNAANGDREILAAYSRVVYFLYHFLPNPVGAPS